MSRAWIRRDLEPRERRALAAAALGAGAVLAGAVYYLGRVLVARDPVETRPPSDPERTLPRPREPGEER